ncbi:MAG: hypothetical protein KAY37_14245 [Phycisphaerae bacterium]|nr:hypothetical protein [Phycisphaerae bacterium]
MPHPVLVQRALLDPRPAEQADADPIADAVNIPFAELPRRRHELPPRGEIIPVVGPAALAEEVVSWLLKNERQAFVQHDFGPAIDAGAPQFGRLWQPNAFLVEVLEQLRPAARAAPLAGGGSGACPAEL